MVKKNYVIIAELNKEIEKQRNFIGYVDGRLNAFDGDLNVIQTRFEKAKKEYNDNTKDLQNARTETLKKIKNLEFKLKKVGKVEDLPEVPKKEEPILLPKETLIEESPKTPLAEAKFTKKQINQVAEELQEVIDELDPANAGKMLCPECGNYYTKGGAFIAHYKACLNIKNGD